MKGADDMAYIEPETTVQFLNVPFDPDYENTMYWSTVSEQETYMETKVLLTIGNNSYQRKTRGVIRVGWTADLQTPVNSVIRALYNANYMRYKNTNYENKWFYAFVKQVEYVNNNTVDVRYEIDVMQTWACDYNLLECFIERQHTVTDEIGEHTVPEGLEHGEYFDTPLAVSSGSQSGNTSFAYTPAVCLVTTFDSQGNYSDGRIIHGRSAQGNLFSGLYYTIWQLTAGNVDAINNTLEAICGSDGNYGTALQIIEKSGVKVPRFLAEGVVALFMMPWEFAGSITGGSVSPPVLNSFDIRTGGSYLIGSYRPRNKKLLCYPYNLMYITNNQGGSAEYRWEDFNNPISCQVNIWGNVSPNGGMYLAPAGYKGYSGENPDEMLQISGFPMCSWSNDAYKAWVAQNAGTIGAGVLGMSASWSSVLTPWLMEGQSGAIAGTSLSTDIMGTNTPSSGGSSILGGLTAGKGLIGSTLGALAQIYDHKRKPPQAHGNANTSLNYQAGLMSFYYYRKHIKEEYAKIIDAYFDMYGYKVNMVGVPNRNARPCYTFIKTIGCAVDGALPADDAKAIQAIFDKGIRFWKSSATFGVYSPLVNNNEVTIVG